MQKVHILIKKKIIYTIVSSNEIPKIKDIALKYDKKAFISVNDVTEVKGRGFKAKRLIENFKSWEFVM